MSQNVAELSQYNLIMVTLLQELTTLVFMHTLFEISADIFLAVPHMNGPSGSILWVSWSAELLSGPLWQSR